MYLAQLKGLSRTDAKKRIGDLMEKFEIIDLTRTGKIALPRVAGQDA